jgi:hypothetical protein
MTFDQQLEEAKFVRRQIVLGTFGWTDLSKEINQARATSGDIGAPAATTSRRLSVKRAGGVFQKIPGGPGAQRIEDAFIVVVNRLHQQQHLREARFQKRYAVNGAHARQTDIDQRGVGHSALISASASSIER